ncbi:glycoside hydrolase family 43 protein [Deinococcus cellulosilyticus]|uniref:Glycosyl hydrolase n=1 Tax=Deinococcus cellulosilyticus (strain DSM 18568 / NBRC 106333 / KACC 11606 / 5516J-15) TaxID=1223518 RepID=A0A511N1P2_DEIC1|nr:family 43 glycosylhydrolase [Deinococcus cellulosilyticus]GEM46790.1 glycosyl hydrolase [Deinococcus cellulosilyticus NBRC 106333 = KACC 11606]
MPSQPVFPNPLVEQRADPWVHLHTDGYYYFTGSVPEYDRIELRRARKLEDLTAAETVVVWRKYPTGPMSANIWAPELHFIDGKWYIYFAAARTTETRDGLFDHRMFVLECDAENPLEGQWVEKGQLKTKWETFALDATTFEHRGKRYLVWAQKNPEIFGNSNLYISEMENPWTLKGEQVMLTTPEYPWEVIGFLVNEGPAVLKRNGRIFISFSASATDHHYCMGLLSAPEDADLLDPDVWTKSREPVFQTSEKNRQYGPGHNSFTTLEDGTDVLIFHARSYKEIVGDPLYDPNRHARAQVFGYAEDGTPVFGVPLPDTQKEPAV